MNKPKRVLQVIGGMNIGGAEVLIMNIYRKLDRSKIQFDFLVYTEKKCYFEDEIKKLGGRLIYVPAPKECGVIKHIKKLKKIVLENGPYCAIHAHTLHNNMYSIYVGHRLGIKRLISHSHNTDTYQSNKLIKKAYILLAKKIITKFSTDYFACGEDAGVYLFGKIFKEKGKIIKNGIDVDLYDIPKKGTNKIVIGNIARLEKVKNHRYMIKIAEKLKIQNFPFEMIFVGDGSLMKDLGRIVEEKNLNSNIKFLGIRNDIPKILKTFDCFIMPSLYEGLPVSLIEAQAAKIPCIIADNITKQVDLGLSLITYLPIENSSIDLWVEKIISSEYREISFDKIKEVFVETGYDINQTAKEMEKIYLSEI